MESLCKGGSIDGKLWYSEARHAASCNLKRFAHEYGVFNEKRLPLPNMIPRRLHKEIACITFATSELNDYRSYGNLKQRIYFTLYTKQAHSVTILTWKGKVACCKSLSFEFWKQSLCSPSKSWIQLRRNQKEIGLSWAHFSHRVGRYVRPLKINIHVRNYFNWFRLDYKPGASVTAMWLSTDSIYVKLTSSFKLDSYIEHPPRKPERENVYLAPNKSITFLNVYIFFFINTFSAFFLFCIPSRNLLEYYRFLEV